MGFCSCLNLLVTAHMHAIILRLSIIVVGLITPYVPAIFKLGWVAVLDVVIGVLKFVVVVIIIYDNKGKWRFEQTVLMETLMSVSIRPTIKHVCSRPGKDFQAEKTMRHNRQRASSMSKAVDDACCSSFSRSLSLMFSFCIYRLLALSTHEPEVSVEVWERMKELEKRRLTRVAVM